MRGKCSKDEAIVHQYSLRVDNTTLSNGSHVVRVNHADIVDDRYAHDYAHPRTRTHAHTHMYPPRCDTQLMRPVTLPAPPPPHDSCLNGWTCGNIAASVGDISNWWWDIFHQSKLVK